MFLPKNIKSFLFNKNVKRGVQVNNYDMLNAS